MKENRDISTPCIVRAHISENPNCPEKTSIKPGDLRECRITAQVNKLMAMGTTSNRYELNKCEPVMQAICEFALSDQNSEIDKQTPSTTEATMSVIKDQLAAIEMEAEMLRLRKRALKRRMRALEKLNGLHNPTGTDPAAP